MDGKVNEKKFAIGNDQEKSVKIRSTNESQGFFTYLKDKLSPPRHKDTTIK